MPEKTFEVYSIIKAPTSATISPPEVFTFKAPAVKAEGDAAEPPADPALGPVVSAVTFVTTLPGVITIVS